MKHLFPYSVSKIIFISPRNMELGYFYEFLPKAVPWGVGLMASRMRDLGYDVQLWDLNTRDLSSPDIAKEVPDGGEGVLFGLSCLTANAAQGYQIARMLKDIAPSAKIVFGGIHPTALPDEPMEKGFADAVVRGEAEESFPELLRRWCAGEDVAGQPGITCRNEAGKVVHGPPAPYIDDLDQYPGFPYDMIDLSKYNLGMIITSRGCPYDCIFCSQRLITGRRFRFRSTEKVMADLEYLINICGQTYVMFVDDLFTGNKKRLIELCREMQQRGLHEKCIFGAQVRADSIDEEILNTLIKSGFKTISFGIETSSERLMAFIRKKETLAHIVQKALLAKSYGLLTEGVFIFGFPGETFDDRLRAVKLAKEMGLGRLRFNNLTPYPGTHVYEIALEEKRLTIQSGWGNFNSAGAASAKIGSRFVIPYVPQGTTDGAIQGEVILSNIYSSFRQVFHMVTATKEPSGMGFELTFRELLKPRKAINLSLAILNVMARTVWFLMTERECCRFLMRIMRNVYPEMDSAVRQALDHPPARKGGSGVSVN
jgi:anaerobic magnesium-protoporphyrin IX monomethyl ester cyclase